MPISEGHANMNTLAASAGFTIFFPMPPELLYDNNCEKRPGDGKPQRHRSREIHSDKEPRKRRGKSATGDAASKYLLRRPFKNGRNCHKIIIAAARGSEDVGAYSAAEVSAIITRRMMTGVVCTVLICGDGSTVRISGYCIFSAPAGMRRHSLPAHSQPECYLQCRFQPLYNAFLLSVSCASVILFSAFRFRHCSFF